MKQPLLPVVLMFVAGILAAEFFNTSPAPLLAIALSLLATALSWERARPRILYPLLVLAGAICLTMQTAVLSPNDLRRILPREPSLVTVRGTVGETPNVKALEQDGKTSWRTQARIQVDEIRINQEPWRSAVGRVAVTAPVLLTNLFAGQTVEVAGFAEVPRAAAAPGTFDYQSYLKRQGVYFQLKTASEQDWRILHSPRQAPLSDRFRTWARSALARGLPEEDESLRLEWALTLGWKPALTEEVSEPFVRAATYHIFAVDGLRMAIIFGIFLGLFRAVGLPRNVCGLILIPLIWFYVALTGWPASAIRATVMLTIVILGWALKRPTDLINSLLTAALIILVWEPQQLFQAGFQMSFLVVLCMILILPPLWRAADRLLAGDPLLPPQLRRRWPPLLAFPARYTSDLLHTSFAAWIGSIPLVALYFNIFTPVSTPANVLAVPLCGLVLISNLASLLLAGWLPAVATIFNHSAWFWMEAIRISSHWFAEWPLAYFYIPAPGLFASSIYYGLLLGLLTGWLFKPPLPRLKLALAGALAIAACWGEWWQAQVPRITLLAANGGTAIYCGPGTGTQEILIDPGTTNAAQFLAKSFLRAQGVNRVEGLVLSHGDTHHVGGAEILAECFAVPKVYASPLRFRSAVYRRSLAHFREKPERLQAIGRHDVVSGWQVLHPDASDKFSKADDGAVVLAGTVRSTRVLLVSDLGRAGQAALLSRSPDLRADILITGLPSSGEPIGDDFIDAVQPKAIIVCDSEFPVTERASPGLRARLGRGRTPVLYTRFFGTTTVEFRRKGWLITGMNGTWAPNRVPEPRANLKPSVQQDHDEAEGQPIPIPNAGPEAEETSPAELE